MEDHSVGRTVQNIAVGVGIFLLLRWCVKNWRVFVVLWLLSYLLYLFDRGPEKDAAMAAFNKGAVTMVAQTPVYWNSSATWLEAKVRNDGQARIYNLSFDCTFRTVTKPERDPPFRSEKVSTRAQYGFIKPGDTVSTKLAFEPNGWLMEADKDTFSCTPMYLIEPNDMYKVVGKSDLNLLAQTSVDLRHRFEDDMINGNERRMEVFGTFKNESEKRIRLMRVECYATNTDHVEQSRQTEVHIGANPGETVRFKGTMPVFKSMHAVAQTFCRPVNLTPVSFLD